MLDGLREWAPPMAEPPPITPSMTAAAERDVLATKLHVPRTRPGFVARPRLADRLAGAQGGELTLVCAPAGFGKTTLLAEWARGGQRPVAWLSLDEADNDPARFWRHAAAALDRVHPGVAEQVAALLGPPPPASFEGLVAALVNQLAEVTEEAALVVDDYHLIQAPAVHASLGFLLEHLPPSLGMVLASRSDPPLPLARLRGRGQLTEVRAADLRFTPKEAAELLATAVGPVLPDSAVAALGTRTEGWAAGLQLAALSLRGHTDVTAFVEGFSGSHRYVLDYLAEEVLDRQPEPLRAFLLETSVLARLCGPLGDAVTGRTDSQELLEQVERANLFLVPLDDERRWWRYHHLFADLLRARLARERPDRVAELHQAAAVWCDEHGLVDEAVQHTLAAGDAVGAARLIEQHFDALQRRGEDATLRRWLQALPAELVRSRPRLCLAQAVAAVTDVRLEAAESWLADAEQARTDHGEEAYAPSVGRAVSLLANVPAAIALVRAVIARMHGDAERTNACSQQALAELDEQEWMLRSLAEYYLAVARWLYGQVVEAEQAFAGLAAEQQAAGARYIAQLYHDLGQVQRARGRLGAALGTYRQLLEVAAAPGQPALPAAGIAHQGMAEVLYERGELDAALDHATQGVALCRQLGWTLALAKGLAILAWIRHARGDRAGALEAIREAEQVERPAANMAGLLNPLPAVRARLALANSETADATRWLQERRLGIDDQPTYPCEREYLVLARLLLAEHNPDAALGLLGRLDALAVAQQRFGSVIEVRALRALAHAAAGDEPAALAALAEALALGAPQGYLRVFVDEGPPMAALSHKLLAGRRHKQVAATGTAKRRQQLARLMEAFEQAGLPIVPPARRGAVMVPGLVEPLSARELEVLELLATGKPNKAIAEELVVTLETVKKHLTHIFDKLGAGNRTQAVAQARELELLR